MKAKIIYNSYSNTGRFLGERTYYPADYDDFERVIDIIERNPEIYELVNCDYEAMAN